MTEQQEKRNYSDTFYKNAQRKKTGKKKSTWKKEKKEKIIPNIKKKITEEMAGRMKC